MAIRYTPEELKRLRDSPLVGKPPALPPTEQWMGPPTDSTRNTTRSTIDRAQNHDSNMLPDQTSRRPGPERHIPRNSANPEDIILGPPKTSFLSATSAKSLVKSLDPPDRTGTRGVNSRERYPFRGKAGDGDSREGGRNSGVRPKRTEGEQDSDGWSMVKPRKSFGTDGAERFNGRMGIDRHQDEGRFKDCEDRETRDRPRGYDGFSRDQDGGDTEQDRDHRKNGAGRGRHEPSWFKDRDNSEAPPTHKDHPSNGDRYVDRSRGWREKERDDRGEKSDRGDRRWDRDRQEREPEWMDEPADDKNQTHTQEDFQKWKEEMQGKAKPGRALDDVKPESGSLELEKQKVETPLEIDAGPDKFFGMWAAPKDELGPDATAVIKAEVVAKSRTTGKASRFTSFFTPQDEPQRHQAEPHPPVPLPPQGGFDGFSQNSTQSSAEKEAFQQLLQKLQRQTVAASGATPPANILLQSKPPLPEAASSSVVSPLEQYQHFRPDRQEEGRRLNARHHHQALRDLLNQRQIARPEQMLQELVGHRLNASSQSSVRPDQPPSRNTNTEFLMGLMQNAKSAPDPQRSEQVLLRMPPPKSVDRQIYQQVLEREQEGQRDAALRDHGASQRRLQPPLPGFFDEPSFQRGPQPQLERQPNPPQPTQILQRPPPPGLDLGWDRQPQLPQHRVPQNIVPPPGLANGPNRGMTMSQQMFPPGFPMGNFPPPDIMAGPSRNMQMQPPPGFFNAPPPGFMAPGMGGGFQGPEGLGFGAPFDGRGPLPPQGTFRRQ